MSITLELDDETLASLPLGPGERERHMQIELACRYYANGWLTLGQAAKLAKLGPFEPVLVERLGRLFIFRPPIENLIAAKLIRADARDLGDIRFLLDAHRPRFDSIRGIVAALEPAARKRALENLVYLDILKS